MDNPTMRVGSAGFMMQAFLWAFLPTLVLVLTAPAVGGAQAETPTITPTPGAEGLHTTVTPVAANYNITGGTRPGGGSILFHSFGDFNVPTNSIANFLNKGSFDLSGTLLADGLATSNILARVTNPNPSSILGTIQTNGDGGFGTANLFLMNPSGILFGPNASLNVGGSVSFTTAQYIRLFDGLNNAYFYANQAFDGQPNSVFTVAPVGDFGFLPAAYGFLDAPNPLATITVQGSALSVPSAPPGSPPNSISLVGGKVVIQGAQLPDGTVQRAQLSAPNGSILLATSASPGEFDTTLFAGPNVGDVPFTSYASVSLGAGSSIDVSGGHTMWIKGGQLVLSVNDATLNTSGNTAQTDTILLGPGSVIWTSNSGTDSSAPDLQLIAADVKITGGAYIQSQTDGSGRGGNVNVTADRVTMEQFAGIFTLTSGAGAGGNVNIQGLPASAAEFVTLSGGSQVANFTSGSGAGGGISITAKSLDLNGGSTLLSSTSGSGPNGDILVSVQKASLSNGATFDSKTSFFGETNPAGGKITVQGLPVLGKLVTKADSLILEGPGTAIKSEAQGGGLLGDIEVHAKTVSLMDGAEIRAGTLLDSATAGDIAIEAGSVGISGGSHISSHAFSSGAGQVKITATDQLTLDHSSIETDSSSPTGGPGGDVILNAGSVSLTNGATINSSTSGTGPAGNIAITTNVGTLTLTNGSQISSASTGPDVGAGNAGKVTITSSDAFTSNASTVATTAENAKGGDILINAQSVELSNGTLISGNSNASLLPEGGGDAGNITINSASNVIMQNSSVTTKASQASGGQVTINAPEMVQMINSKVITSVAGFEKDTAGGNISIDPNFVILQNSQILAQAFAGNGGAISIVSNVFLADANSLVDATSQRGISGTVDIRAPVQNVSGELVVLSQDFASAAALLAQQCAARVADGKFSTFVVAAREGLPVEPGGFLASPSFLSELGGPALSGRSPQSPRSAVEGSFPEYDARPLQLAKLGNACHR